MLINQYTENSRFHIFFASFLSSRSLLFSFSILLFFTFPILGCIPILLLLQSRISQRFIKGINFKDKNTLNRIDLIYLFLVLFAIVIYGTTYNIRSDLLRSLNIYSDLSGLDIYGFIDYFFTYDKYTEYETEPLAYLIPHLAGMLFGHSDGLFLLVQSLTFNLVFVFLAYKFFPFFYPTIILINITSFYYFQYIFVLRQWYSFLFLLPMTLVPSIFVNILLSVFAYLSHRSSLFYSIPLLLMSSIPFSLQNPQNIWFKLFPYLNNSLKSILFNKKLILVLSLFLFPLFSFSLATYTDLSEEAYAMRQVYEEVYSLDNTPFSVLLFLILPEFILLTVVVGFVFSKKLLSKNYVLNSFFVVALISLVMMIFVYSSGLNSVYLRPLLSWSGLKGFFYPTLFLAAQVMEKKNKYLSSFLFSLLKALIFISIFRFLLSNLLYIFSASVSSETLDYILSRRSASSNSVLNIFAFQHLNNQMPTVSNNLVDYLMQLYALITSPDDFWRRKALDW